VACSLCGQPGHNAKTCPNRAGATSASGNSPSSAPGAPVPVPPATSPKVGRGDTSMGFWDKFLEIITKLRTPGQVGTALLAVVAFSFTAILPQYVLGLLAGGFIGVYLFMILSLAPLAKLIPESQRLLLILPVLLVFSVVIVILFYITYNIIIGPIPVKFGIKVDNMPSISLDQHGSPPNIEIKVNKVPHILSFAKDGTGVLPLPWGSDRFAITFAVWHGFILSSPLDQPITFSDGKIVIEFKPDPDCTRQLVPSEIILLGRRMFGFDNDEKLIKKLNLKPLPDRDPATEYEEDTVRVRNESNESIIVNFVDCDDLVWDKPTPFAITGPYYGTNQILPSNTSDIKHVFRSMSVFNRTFAVLVCWEDKAGTTNRYFRLAGFVVLRPPVLEPPASGPKPHKQTYRLYRLRLIIGLLGLAIFCLESVAQQQAVTVTFRNILGTGESFIAQIEQHDAQGAVVNITKQTVANGALGSISVIPGTRYTIRELPSGGGGHTHAWRDLAADFAANKNRPLPLNGKYDETGRRIAMGLVVGDKEIIAPRMEYPGTEGVAKEGAANDEAAKNRRVCPEYCPPPPKQSDYQRSRRIPF
jgi:hypothetical protein